MSGAGRSAGEAAEHLLVTAPTGGTEAIDMLLSVVWRPRRIWPRAPLDLLGPGDARRPPAACRRHRAVCPDRRIGETRTLAAAALSHDLPAEAEATIRLAVRSA